MASRVSQGSVVALTDVGPALVAGHTVARNTSGQVARVSDTLSYPVNPVISTVTAVHLDGVITVDFAAPVATPVALRLNGVSLTGIEQLSSTRITAVVGRGGYGATNASLPLVFQDTGGSSAPFDVTLLPPEGWAAVTISAPFSWFPGTAASDQLLYKTPVIHEGEEYATAVSSTGVVDYGGNAPGVPLPIRLLQASDGYAAGADGAVYSAGVDETPDAFTFDAVAGQAPSTVATSNVVIIAGITPGAEVDVTVSGGEWQKSTDGGATWGAWGTAAGTAMLATRLRVRATSAATDGATVTVSLTVGGVTGQFAVTTVADTVPAPLVFSARSAVIGDLATSAILQVAAVSPGVDIPVEVSGGEYRAGTVPTLEGVDWTSEPGVVQLGYYIQLRGAAPSEAGEQALVSVSVGDYATTFPIFALEEPDTEPDSFSFTAVANAEPGSAHVSNAISLLGVTEGVDIPVTVTGAEWQASADFGTNWSAFTTSAGTVRSGAFIRLRASASNTAAGIVQPTLTVGGVSATWTITTAADVTPEAFTFTPALNVAAGQTVESNVISVSGVTPGVDIPVTVAGGQWQYTSNGGISWSSYADTSGVVRQGYWVRVRGAASLTASATQNVTLTMGSVSASFPITTVVGSDTTPDAFAFNSIIGAPLNTSTVSAAVQVAGVTPGIDIPVSVSTGANYQVSTDGGITWGTATSAAGVVRLGHMVRVVLVSANANGATSQASLSIGGISASFSVTTVESLVSVMPPVSRMITVEDNFGALSPVPSMWGTSRPVKGQAVAERLDYGINWYNALLRAGDVISSYAVTGVDLQITGTSLVAGGSHVVFWVEGVDLNVNHLVTCQITTAGGRVMIKTFEIHGVVK